MEAPMQRQFSPYTSNGGTVLAMCGDDFALLACDTRLSESYEILSRDCTKIYPLTSNSLLGCSGFHGDTLTLTKNLDMRRQMYEHQHLKSMSTRAIAQCLSNTLYYRRFFPFYVNCVLVGLDEEGKGAVYSYDSVGSYERETYRAGGTAASLLQPLLDNQLGYKNIANAEKPPLTLERAVGMVKDVFIAAGERDIYTGDQVEIQIVTKDGVRKERCALRRD